MKTIVIPLLSVWLWGLYASGVCHGADGTSPHREGGDCVVCHVLTKQQLVSKDAASHEKQRLRKDFVALCRDCHGDAFGHGVGMIPSQNVDNLPLDTAGKITCAVTCHDMHVQNSSNPAQTRTHLRIPAERLCFGCHAK